MKIRYKVLVFLVVLSIITYLDRVCMNVVSKYVKADLALDNQQFGYILGAFSLAYAFFELPTGILGDSIGPRKVLTRVVLWWSGFTALTGSAFSFSYLLIVRFLFGMGEAGAYPNSSIAVARWFPAAELGRAQAAIWSAGPPRGNPGGLFHSGTTALPGTPQIFSKRFAKILRRILSPARRLHF